VTLKEGYGFIRCTDRDARMFFHYSELLDLDREIRAQQEVEFTVVQVGICRVVVSLQSAVSIFEACDWLSMVLASLHLH